MSWIIDIGTRKWTLSTGLRKKRNNYVDFSSGMAKTLAPSQMTSRQKMWTRYNVKLEIYTRKL